MRVWAFIGLSFISLGVYAQLYTLAPDGFRIKFFSSTPLEDIAAVSKIGRAVIQSTSNTIQIKLNTKDFHFKNALMEEHFNENYMETERFPHSTFSGTILGLTSYTAEGQYNVTVRGDLEMHGVKKPVQIPGTLLIKNQKLILHSTFSVLLKDYNIKIPSLYITNIAEKIEITFDAQLIPYVK
ncbi:MAG: hypothetical protein RIR05_1310 [Bacteroidota bacterium]